MKAKLYYVIQVEYHDEILYLTGRMPQTNPYLRNAMWYSNKSECVSEAKREQRSYRFDKVRVLELKLTGKIYKTM